MSDMMLNIRLRAMQPDDVECAGRILQEATAALHRDHGLPEPLADAGHGAALVRRHRELDPGGAWVVELDNRVVGSGFVHLRGPLAVLGPMAIAPAAQARGLGKRLVHHLVEQAGRERPLRAMIDAFNGRALGIAAREGLAVRGVAVQLVALGGLRGPGRLLALGKQPVRPLAAADLEAVVAYDASHFGAARRRELEWALAGGGESEGLLIEEDGRLGGYLCGRVEESLAILGPGVADSAAGLAVLLARLGERFEGRAHIVRTCLSAGAGGVLQHAFSMGFRATSTMLLVCRGNAMPDARPSAAAPPPAVV